MKIKQAYSEGINRDERNTHAHGRLGKAAFKLGQRSADRLEKDNAEHDRRNSQYIEEALKQAKGLNKQVLEIIAATSEIPNGISSKPKHGYFTVNKDGEWRREWVTVLHSGEDIDPSRPSKMPMAEKLGTLKVDSADWAHNGLTTPVHNIQVSCSALLGDSSETRPNDIREMTSKIFINSTPYDPDIPLDESVEFSGEAVFNIDNGGEVDSVGLVSGRISGITPENATGYNVNLEEVLDDVLESVHHTAGLYKTLDATIETQ